jgi:hypothetical protein
MGKKLDKHKVQQPGFIVPTSDGGRHVVQLGSPILTAEQVATRVKRCTELGLCFISLKPLTEETKFTLFTNQGAYKGLQVPIHVRFTEGAII